jgi:ppGpp synthetase/RelA/SpoT-type nucleotidyltranferase
MPSDDLSGSQLEKLGDRLRAGPLTLADLQQLRRFLETLEPFAETTFAQIRDIDAGAVGLRPAQIARRNVKTIRSVVAKLRRQTTKLVQIQDLVGCRLVVPDAID